MRAPQRLRMAYDEPEIEEGYDDEEDDEEDEDEDEEDESEETWQVGSGEGRVHTSCRSRVGFA